MHWTGPACRSGWPRPQDRLGGDDPANIVNRLTRRRAGGIQIEQDAAVRDDHWCAVAEAVVRALDTLPGPRHL